MSGVTTILWSRVSDNTRTTPMLNENLYVSRTSRKKKFQKQSQTHEEQHTKTYQGQELRLTASCCTTPPRRMDLRQLHGERWRPRTLSFVLQLQRTKGLRCPHATQTLGFNREHKEPLQIRRRMRSPHHSQNIMTQFC